MNETGSIAIHYLNFLIETIPISMENIEKAAACVIRISSSSPEAEKLRSILLSAESGHFDNRVVRAKIEQLATDDIFVDIDGGIRFEPSGHERSLSKDGFEELSQLMNRLAPWDECH